MMVIHVNIAEKEEVENLSCLSENSRLSQCTPVASAGGVDLLYESALSELQTMILTSHSQSAFSTQPLLII